VFLQISLIGANLHETDKVPGAATDAVRLSQILFYACRAISVMAVCNFHPSYADAIFYILPPYRFTFIA